jgi:hypothetical protein
LDMLEDIISITERCGSHIFFEKLANGCLGREFCPLYQ